MRDHLPTLLASKDLKCTTKESSKVLYKTLGPRNENGLDEAFALLKSHGCIYGASKNDFDNGTVIKRIVFTLKFRKVPFLRFELQKLSVIVMLLCLVHTQQWAKIREKKCNLGLKL